MKAGEHLKRIRAESPDESTKGRRFEELFIAVARQVDDFEIEDIWRWYDWPQREILTSVDGRDLGIDVVARNTYGELIAIQCKCYDEQSVLGMDEINNFLAYSQLKLAGSQQNIFDLRWIVSTCPLNRNAEMMILNTGVREVDFLQYLDVEVDEPKTARPVQEPWPLQAEAIENVVEGFTNHDRGRLIMACGTGKTFTSLRIAEQVVRDGGRILFVAPSISLVSQARREWLRHTTRKLECIVVCSDTTAGKSDTTAGKSDTTAGKSDTTAGKSDTTAGKSDMTAEDSEEPKLFVSQLFTCSVSTDPRVIADKLTWEGTCVVFCTYQSLREVITAQKDCRVSSFDLAIADEAHRTTGKLLEKTEDQVNFQDFHNEERLIARKRLYMTATPRIYTEKSKKKEEEKGIQVVDMGDSETYGPEFYPLSFKEAVKHGMLSDYRVIVLGVGEESVTPEVLKSLQDIETEEKQKKFPMISERKNLQDIETEKKQKQFPKISDMTRVLGVSLAVNGVTEGSNIEKPGPLPRVIAFANSIVRSKWYAKALMDDEVLSVTTRRMQSGDRTMNVTAIHLDASASDSRRNQERRRLEQANKEGEGRIICNVRLFTEGVDVPSLDAVAFLDPRNSQIDVVQAVGRVMRKAPEKRFGYIIIPVIIPPGQDVAEALMKGSEGYHTVGQVLKALQSHDGRLAETPATFVKVYELDPTKIPENNENSVLEEDDAQSYLPYLEEVEQGIYAHVSAASGLGKPGQVVADDIANAVHHASRVFESEKQEDHLAKVLDLVPEEDGGAKGVCTIAALMLCNACLLQRRLRDEPQMKTIIPLDKVGVVRDPLEILEVAWESILDKDYVPVFHPAVAILKALWRRKSIQDVIRSLAECANRVADSLSELGYDHAGPLYHRILGSAKSDGAFYTNNISAIILARLAFSKDLIDWSDTAAVAKLRVMDPACGTGTLLMASMKTIKERVAAAQGMNDDQREILHKQLVENVLCGLDINQHGIQLAACNLTLGAPTVDYKRMNLVTMYHGPHPKNPLKLGSLDILGAAEDDKDLASMDRPQRHFKRRSEGRDAEQVDQGLDAEQVDQSEDIMFPLRDLDVVIMNPPFTASKHRSTKYGESGKKKMAEYERELKKHLEAKDKAVKGVIHSESVQSFFVLLAETLINPSKGTLAKVIPSTACTGASGLMERKFLAKRFHVETVITTHDPKRINFSENTNIHESLLICRRRSKTNQQQNRPTRFFALRVMPSTVDEAIEVADEIAKAIETADKTTDKNKENDTNKWFTLYQQSETRIRNGDWRPYQFLDPVLIKAATQIDEQNGLTQLAKRYPLGPPGQAIRGTFKPVRDAEGDYRVFWGRSSDLRTTMEAVPEKTVIDKKKSATQYRTKGGHVLLAAKFDTHSGKLLAIFSEQPALGSMWVPIQASYMSKDEAKALCAWFNSTAGVLQFLFCRSTKLTNPSFSQAALRTLRVPDFRKTSLGPLVSAYEQTKLIHVRSWKEAVTDPVREVLDRAVSETIDIPFTTLCDWRYRISLEPTICNKRATFVKNSE